MSIKLTKVEAGKYRHESGYTVTRGEWRDFTTLGVRTSWQVQSPDGTREECDTLSEAREWIADALSEKEIHDDMATHCRP